MKRFGVIGATALSLSLAIAAPVLAQEAHGNAAGARAGGAMGARAGGANAGGARMAGPRMGNVGAQANFRGAQTNVRGPQANAGRQNFVGRGNAQFAQDAYRGGEFRGDRGRGFRRDIAAGAVAAGVATAGAIALGNGYYNDGYYDPNYAYGDSYAYGDGVTYDTGLPLVAFDQPQGPVAVEGAVGGDASYCAQRYRSYDPASGTYLGYDGLRHPCE